VLWQSVQNIHVGGNFGNFSWSRDCARAALVRADWQHPPELVAGPVGHFSALTQVNADLAPAWGKAVSLEWQRGGQTIQGWLLYPRDFDPNRRYPMVVSVHGGPANLNQPHWPDGSFEPSLLAGLGYFVFFPNPRGSYGQGEAFTRANVKDFGYGDLQDILAGVDKVLASVPVDPQRLGITGWSYGGYMTMWAVTQTGRFRAAVAGAGLADWISYYGENSIDRWMIPYFGASVYDDPAVYARSAPMTYFKQVHTPTLVVVGERDGECPAPQSYEFWHALRALGVPTQLVVYPGEGHLFQQSAHIQDVMARTLDWFNRYLGGGAPE
ncbi:MAG: alpha/beta hydrolase family protein, partial [Terriglobales bacterium]